MAVSAASPAPAGEHAALHVPVRPLPDARLSPEPPAVCLRDVLRARGEDVENEAPAGDEEPERAASAARRSSSVSAWSSGAERRRHQPHLLGHGRVAVVLLAQVD